MSDSDVQWSAVKAQIVALAPTWAGWDKVTVFAGPVNTNTLPIDDATQTAAWATVGYTTEGKSGDFTFEQAADGYRQVERGTVQAELSFQGGSTDPDAIAALETALFAAISGVKAAIRADRRLGGVLSQEGFASVAVTHIPTQATGGAAVLARLVIAYYTVT